MADRGPNNEAQYACKSLDVLGQAALFQRKKRPAPKFFSKIGWGRWGIIFKLTKKWGDVFFEDSHMDPADTPRGSPGGKEFKPTLRACPQASIVST